MEKRRTISRIIGIMLVFAVAVSVAVPQAYAASGKKVKMTNYNTVKKGSAVYCAAHYGLYKYDLKTGSLKKLVSANPEERYDFIDCISVHKGYVYYIKGDAITVPLYRIKTNGKGKKRIGAVLEYGIRNKKIYYTTLNSKTEKTEKKQMSLNGKHKKNSRFKIKRSNANSNNKAYYVERRVILGQDRFLDDGEWMIREHLADYLIIAGGDRVLLCQYDDERYED